MAASNLTHIQWIFLRLLLVCTAALPVASESGFAVTEKPEEPDGGIQSPRVSPATPAAPLQVGRPLRIEIPVSWQVTRSRILGDGAMTVTENFRETWTLELRRGGFVDLISERSRVSVYLSPCCDPAEWLSDGGGTLMLTKQAFARLVGLEGKKDGVGTPPADPTGKHLLSLTFPKGKQHGTDLKLARGEDRHFSVHVEVGRPDVY